MKKKKSRKGLIILIVVVVIVALAVIGFLNMRANIEELMKTTYDIVGVQKSTIQVKVKGAGAATPLHDDTVYAAFSGTVQQVLVENGDVVAMGDVIAMFESDALETELDALETKIDEIDATIASLRFVSGSDTIQSPVEGTVKAVYAEDGDNVDIVMDEYGALALVCPDDIMQTVIPLAEDISLGQQVTVTVDTTSLQGDVYAIDTNAKEITVRFEDDDFGLGDSVTVSAVDGADIGEGVISIANPITITGQGGVIDNVYEDVGETVSRGGKMFALDGELLSAELYSQIEARSDAEKDLREVKADLNSLTVRADKAGVISQLKLNKEQVVQEGVAMFAIQTNDQIKIDVEIDELDIASIELGMEATVTFDALPEAEYTAKVVKINPIGESVNNVTKFTITLEVDQTGDILLGMSADVEIVSLVAEDVYAIPIEAIQIIDGEKFVVFEEDIDEELMYTPATHKVLTGITDGVVIEITEGLEEGAKVAVPQTRENTTRDMMMGGPGQNSPFDEE